MLNHTGGSLSVIVHTGTDLANVESFGKQDPYLRFSVNLAEKDSWQKTYTHKDAGKNATWNQNFEIPLRGEPNLFIEVMDEESGADELIGFAAIPLAQVAQAPGGNFNGRFAIFTIKGKEAGIVHLNLTVRGFNSPPPGYGQSQQPLQGRSFIDEEHAARVKSLRKKEVAADVGTALLGGAIAIGAGFLGNKIYQEHERNEQEEQQRQEQFEEEKRRLEEDRARMERERQEWESRREQESRQEQRQEYHHEEHHSSSSHHHHHHHSDSAQEWNPVGTYSPGDRVSYHGQVYVCLQGHTSNPTWMPGAAHSLWQPS
ncbi:C2 domain-containing protein [Dichotomocladium elegans]|nr:C2 domain-containing protein [Dichotomocladium elegans]